MQLQRKKKSEFIIKTLFVTSFNHPVSGDYGEVDPARRFRKCRRRGDRRCRRQAGAVYRGQEVLRGLCLPMSLSSGQEAVNLLTYAEIYVPTHIIIQGPFTLMSLFRSALQGKEVLN
jgi:hypothetical protein